MNTKIYFTAALQSLVASTVILTLLGVGYFFIEPQVGRAQDTSTFRISQVITGEISFLVDAANTTLVGSLNGITGGTATSSTYAVVQTNSSTGYTMNIRFATTSSGQAMEGENTASDSIHDYPASGGEPTFLFSTASTAAVFGYTVSAADSSDLEQSFLDDGAACNTGSGYTADRCWMEPMFTNYQIIDRGTDATTGATTTIHFRVHVPNNPNPGLVADTYTATATLTAANQ